MTETSTESNDDDDNIRLSEFLKRRTRKMVKNMLDCSVVLERIEPTGFQHTEPAEDYQPREEENLNDEYVDEHTDEPNNDPFESDAVIECEPKLEESMTINASPDLEQRVQIIDQYVLRPPDQLNGTPVTSGFIDGYSALRELQFFEGPLIEYDANNVRPYSMDFQPEKDSYELDIPMRPIQDNCTQQIDNTESDNDVVLVPNAPDAVLSVSDSESASIITIDPPEKSHVREMQVLMMVKKEKF